MTDATDQSAEVRALAERIWQQWALDLAYPLSPGTVRGDVSLAHAALLRQADEIARLTAERDEQAQLHSSCFEQLGACETALEAAESQVRQLESKLEFNEKGYRLVQAQKEDADAQVRQLQDALGNMHAQYGDAVTARDDAWERNASLKAALAACERDAARYRWLREMNPDAICATAWRFKAATAYGEPDAAIDAAMSKEPQK